MPYSTSQRLRALPPYIFVELDRLREAAVRRGEDIINLGIGDPDQPTPQPIVDALTRAAHNPENHRYPSNAGMMALREEAASYYQRVHGVTVDPVSQVGVLIGSKEGIGHFPLAFADPGDVVLFPEPGYPVYRSSTLFAGAEPYVMPLRKENGFLPDLDAIPPDVARRAKVMFLNYPNNPTAAFATEEFFTRVVEFARRHSIIVVHDAAYIDVVFGGKKALSFLEIPGAMDVGVEMHSLSKTFNMTGWRVGFVAGNAELVDGLLNIKANLDSGVFNAVQMAATAALRSYEELVPDILATYESRLAAVNDGIAELGWKGYAPPAGTFYVWLETPNSRPSMDFTKDLIERCAIITTPGLAFGGPGEGFFRIALTTTALRTREAFARIKAAGF